MWSFGVIVLEGNLLSLLFISTMIYELELELEFGFDDDDDDDDDDYQ